MREDRPDTVPDGPACGLLCRLVVRRLDPAIREEVFEPAWHDLRASAAGRRGRRLLLPAACLAIAVQSVLLQRRRASLSRAPVANAWLPQFSRDLHMGVRSLARQPSFAVLCVITLALGIGTTTAVFTLVNGLLLRPLPFRSAERLVAIGGVDAEGHDKPISVPNFEDWQRRSHAFSSLAGATRWRLTDRTDDRAESLSVVLASGAFFETLGVEPILGRVFAEGETGRGADRLAVLSHGLWQRAYGGAAGVIGRVLELGAVQYEIVGVMPPSFGYPSAAETDAYVPLGVYASFLPWTDRESAFGTVVFARLADGYTVAAAQADMNRVSAEIDALAGRAVLTTRVSSFRDVYSAGVRAPLLVLLGAVGFVMLIATANVANLLLTRAEGRRHDLAVRVALGASRAAVLRQNLAESLCLSAAAVVLGVGLAYGGVRILLVRLSDAIPAALQPTVRIDGRVLLFASGLALGTTLLFALVPAWRWLRGAHWTAGLREGTRGGSRGVRSARVRSALVLSEVSLATVLVVGASLMLQTLQGLRRSDRGFVQEAVVTANVALPAAGYPERGQWLGFYEEVLDRLRARPDVSGVGAALLVPLADLSWELRVLPEGVPWDPLGGESVLYNIVTPGFFETMGIPILRGRGFTGIDREGATPVAVIDETMAEHLWPGEDPIGRRLTVEARETTPGSAQPVYRTVVGVVPNVRHYDLRNQARIEIWVPFQQSLENWQQGYFIAVRAAGPDAAALVPALRSTVKALDAEAVVSDVRTMNEYVDREIATERALSTLLGAFGIIALALAAIGVFGLMSILVSTRAREIGIRMTVGARPRAVLRGVLADALLLAAGGAVAGVLATVALARAIASQLYGVSAVDFRTLLSVAGFLVLVALAAAFLPALRAARVDPVSVLRGDA